MVADHTCFAHALSGVSGQCDANFLPGMRSAGRPPVVVAVVVAVAVGAAVVVGVAVAVVVPPKLGTIFTIVGIAGTVVVVVAVVVLVAVAVAVVVAVVVAVAVAVAVVVATGAVTVAVATGAVSVAVGVAAVSTGVVMSGGGSTDSSFLLHATSARPSEAPPMRARVEIFIAVGDTRSILGR